MCRPEVAGETPTLGLVSDWKWRVFLLADLTAVADSRLHPFRPPEPPLKSIFAVTSRRLRLPLLDGDKRLNLILQIGRLISGTRDTSRSSTCSSYISPRD